MRSTSQGAGNITSLNGLVLYLDAANRNSYPGSGNTWFDMSGNYNHFTLYNSSTYTGTALRFNTAGGNEYAECINATFGNFGTGSFTIEQIYNVSSSQTYGPILMKKRTLTNNTTLTDAPGWAFNPGGIFRIAPDTATGIDFNSTAYYINVHMAHVIEKNGTSITGSVYVNGVINSTIQSTFGGNNSVDNALNARLMFSYGESQYRTGSLYVMRAYNTALSADDIFQNFTVLSRRFNL